MIYIPGYYGDVALIAKQARMIGLTQPLLGGDGWDAPELWQLGGDALNGSYISTHYSIDDPSPVIQTFVESYKQRYGNLLPDAHAALAYDAARLLFDAITRAGTTESGKLREALAQTKNFAGVTGVISMDADRNAVKPAVVLKLHGSRVYLPGNDPAARHKRARIAAALRRVRLRVRRRRRMLSRQPVCPYEHDRFITTHVRARVLHGSDLAGCSAGLRF